MTLDKYFEFATREPELYALWQSQGVFQPESAADQNSEVFNIAMPPPNANGELHLGHAFGYTVMDILGRFHRMNGKRVLLLPGKDHAGIQTQVVFEKQLKKNGVDYTNVPVEDLYNQCYEFCIDRANYMRSQEYKLGISADWSREFFTLDPRLNDIIFETFAKMWKEGLIYKGTRIINWSVFSQTAISDVEVEYKESEDGFWHIRYDFADAAGLDPAVAKAGMITATTRPETMLGDTALAVNPEDPRYTAIIGKRVRVPLTNREIPIVADKRVDLEFGTGVVKVTPAHDFTDYDIGQDHNLPMIQVIGKDGLMTPEAGEGFAGLTSKACREKVVEMLEQQGQLVEKTTIKHKVPIGERGKDIIEPLISEQWFVNVDKPGASLKGRALSFVREGRIKIYPERFQVLFEQWLENLRDWNISRQIWWGHRLPVWYRTVNGKEEIHVAAQAPEGADWVQEKDTFDTWFSSGQWAYSTFAAAGLSNLDDPEKRVPYFPSHTMVMGRDILFFWACRMLLLTTYRLNDVPWKNIYFTGLIRDEHGQKMSKSKGNGIEPNDMINKYGADSLRLAMVMGAAPGNDLILSERKFDGYSKFINKIWNAGKLLELKFPAVAATSPGDPALETSRWILNELALLQESVSKKMNEYDISIAADELYNFTWSVFCDWYLEAMKALIDSGNEQFAQETRWVAETCFSKILQLLHPIIPFVTEEMFQKLSFFETQRAKGTLAVQLWDAAALGKYKRADGSAAFQEVQKIVTAIRSVKAALNLSQKRTKVAMEGSLSAESALLVQELAKVDFVEAAQIDSANALKKPYGSGAVICEVEGKENYKKRLEKDLENNRGVIDNLEKKLAGSFATQAKPDVVEKERERLSQAKAAVVTLQEELALL